MKKVNIHMGSIPYIILCAGLTLSALSLLYVAFGLRYCPGGGELTSFYAAKLQLEYALATLAASIGGAYICDLVMNLKSGGSEK